MWIKLLMGGYNLNKIAKFLKKFLHNHIAENKPYNS